MKRMLLAVSIPVISSPFYSQLLSWSPDFTRNNNTPVVIIMDASNDSHGLLNYSFTSDESSVKDKATLILTDFSGRQLYKKNISLSARSNAFEINRSAFKSRLPVYCYLIAAKTMYYSNNGNLISLKGSTQLASLHFIYHATNLKIST